MRSRNWFPSIMLIGFLTFGILSVPCSSHAQEQAPSLVPENGEKPAGNGSTNPAQENQSAVGLPTGSDAGISSGIEPAKSEEVSEEGESYPNCESGNLSECDLAAQQSMADSTFWMMIAAGAGVGLTVIGLIFVGFTLLYTKKAAEHAKRAAVATEAALDITREMGAAQIQAYLSVVSGKMEVYGMKHGFTFGFDLRLRNTGQSPAKSAKFYGAVIITFSDRVYAGRCTHADAIPEIPSKADFRLTIEALVPYPAELVEGFNRDDFRCVWLAGNLIYWDTFNRRHKSRTIVCGDFDDVPWPDRATLHFSERYPKPGPLEHRT